MATHDIPPVNCIIHMQAPVLAPLPDLLDWSHPQLHNAERTAPESALLAAWRNGLDSRWFFDRQDVDAMLAAMPDNLLAAGTMDLAYIHRCFLKPQELDANLEKRRPTPFAVDRHGQPVWECYTDANAEYVCAVNRFHWLPVAAAAARRNGRLEDAESVLAIMDNWIEHNPVPVDVLEADASFWPYWKRPWAPLNTARRATSWLFVLHLLWDSPGLTAARFGRFLRSLRQHLLWQGLVAPRTDRPAAYNHLVMESETLLYLSTLTWFKEAATARQTALGNLARCINNQVLPDGTHNEHSPHYHRGCMLFFGMPVLLCKLNDWPLHETLASRVNSMLEFGLQMVQPDGNCTATGDGGRSGDSWASEWFMGHLSGRPLPVAAQPPGGGYHFVHNWPPPPVTTAAAFPLARHFSDGGFAAARTSWQPNASALIMKLDGYGGAHSHADFLNISFSYQGRLIIDEQSTRSYNNDTPSVACKMAAAHSVLLLGNRDMMPLGTPDSYWEQRDPCVTITDIQCQAQPDGSMRTGARVNWDDKAWWQRHVDFDTATGGLLIHDSIAVPAPEPVRIQYYLLTANVELEGSCGVRTTDPGLPNIRLTLSAHHDGTRLELTPTVSYFGFFNPQPTTLVTFHIPACNSGQWKTRIEGV